ncbi:hypothetical protein DSM104329_01081 [Capillimicrobium parvum]|uniref:Uncharacterized protein n=1 Tax=Capillimicrobium parvum TaxID=2884022 RepID=A0A9E6XUN2_9ACTN|nr:hypothetical protein DSM104329_01081 [Capillimicrobium parvum]
MYTDAYVKAAIHAWWDTYGAAPKKADWSPQQLKHRNRLRLERFERGWIDDHGARQKYPRHDRVPFDRLLSEVQRDRD